MLRAGGVRRDERQGDVRGGHAGELDLRLLSGLAQTLHGDAVAGEVHALALLELAHEVVGDRVVEVVAAETVVAGGGKNLDDAVADLEDGHVERAAAEVIDHDLLVGFLVQTVGQSGRGRLVDDALDVEASDLAGVLRRLTLGVGEVGGNGDDGLGDGLTQIGLGVALELLQDHRADLLRGVALAVDGDLVVGAHLTLDGHDGAVGVRDGLTLGGLADHALAVLRKSDDGRRGAVAFGVRDDDGLAALHDGHAAVGGAEIDTNNFTHDVFLLDIEKIVVNEFSLRP